MKVSVVSFSTIPASANPSAKELSVEWKMEAI
jgi:hypothetical protein